MTSARAFEARHASAAALFLLQLAPSLSRAQLSPGPAITATVSARLDSVAEGHRRVHQIPGLAIVLATTSGKILFTGNYGFADLGSKRPVSSRTMFRIFSISKPYASAITHQLIEEGRLSLSSPVGRYLAELPAWRDSVHVRDLLAHTSGIEDYTDVPGWRTGQTDEATFVGKALLQPLRFTPGSRWRYSNTNFVLVQRLIEHATRQSYGSVLQNRLLDRYSLFSTTSSCRSPDLALGYLLPSATASESVPDTTANAAQYPPAVGGLCATARDVARFFALLLSGHVVNPASFSEMTRPTPSGFARSGAGLFFQTDSDGVVVAHSGGSSIGTGEAVAFPHDSLLIVALANVGGAQLEQLARSLRRAVLGRPEPVVLDLPFPKEKFAPLLGAYSEEDGPGLMIVDEREGRLYGLGQRLLYQGDGSFVPDKTRDLHVVFPLQAGIATEAHFVKYGITTQRWRRQTDIRMAIAEAQRSPLAGAWLRISLVDAAGTSLQPPNPPAFAIFSADGFFSMSAFPPDRPKLDRSLADMTKEELITRYQFATAFRGSYSVSGNILTRVIIASIDPGDQGRVISQPFRLAGDTLIFGAPADRREARFVRVR